MESVLGADGCPGGWVGAWLTDDAITVVVAESVAKLVAAAGGVPVVGIDMPIGLPDAGAQRAAESLARRRLPVGRKSSVFPTPMRAACEASTWDEANALNKAACGRGLSHQGFGLTRKILEVDAYMRSGPPVRVVEVHPEVSFAAIDPSCVVASKKTADGRAARVAALERAGLGVATRRTRARVRRRRPARRLRRRLDGPPRLARRGRVAPEPTRGVLRRPPGGDLGVTVSPAGR